MRRVAVLLTLLLAATLSGCIGDPEMQDRPPVGQIDGAVVDQLLSPFGNTTVYLEPLGRTDVTSPLGGFTFTDVPPGTYAVVVRPDGSDAARETVVVHDGEVSRTILQTSRAYAPGPYKSALGNHATADVVLPGESCSDCSWRAYLRQVPEEVVLRVEWDAGVDRAIRVVLRDSAGTVLRDITERGSIWTPIDREELDPEALELDVEIHCADDVVPCTTFRVDSFLDVYYGADRESLE